MCSPFEGVGSDKEKFELQDSSNSFLSYGWRRLTLDGRCSRTRAPCSLPCSCTRWPSSSLGKGSLGWWSIGPALHLLQPGSFPSQQEQFLLFRQQCRSGWWSNREVRRKQKFPLQIFAKPKDMWSCGYCLLNSAKFSDSSVNAEEDET